MPAQMNIAVQRNEDFARSWAIEDNAGEPVSIVGCSLAMDVKTRLSNSATIASADIEITDVENGKFELILKASEGSPLGAFGDPLLTYSLPYDLRITYPDGLQEVLIAGTVILSRGKTFA